MSGAGHWSVFLPALCVYPLWLTIGLGQDLFPTISTYWPIGLAMVIGSMIAGSTPLGGGIVAFPVALLVLGFSSSQGRDASLLIQSVGMTAASYLILYKKRHLIAGCTDLITKFVVMSTVGLVIGFELLGGLSPLIVEIVYATLVVCVVFVFMYSDYMDSRKNNNARDGVKPSGMFSRSKAKASSVTLDALGSDGTPSSDGMAADMEGGDDDNMGGGDDAFDDNNNNFSGSGLLPDELAAIGAGSRVKRRSNASEVSAGEDDDPSAGIGLIDGSSAATPESDARAATVLQNICLSLFAITGGILSSLIGSGADVSCYLYGSFVYCKFGPSKVQFDDNALTASSVIVMACMSVLGSVLRLSTREVSEEALYSWFACAPVVVLGAPTGSLFLTPRNQRRLKYSFYALGMIQLVLFGVMKIGNNAVAWMAVSGVIVAVLGSLFVHFLVYRRAVAAHELE